MLDPTANEIRLFLKNIYGDELDEFSQEEAIYWFAYDWHGGQSSNLYSALSTSPYKPGPLSNGPEPEGLGAMALVDLEANYFPSKD